jgi:hypothetical protein
MNFRAQTKSNKGCEGIYAESSTVAYTLVDDSDPLARIQLSKITIDTATVPASISINTHLVKFPEATTILDGATF